jgi:hypothetical protein
MRSKRTLHNKTLKVAVMSVAATQITKQEKDDRVVHLVSDAHKVTDNHLHHELQWLVAIAPHYDYWMYDKWVSREATVPQL